MSQIFLMNLQSIKKDGVMRIVVPDFHKLIDQYKKDKDVEKFIRNSCLVGKKPKTSIKKLQYLLQGHGWHHQMFNDESLTSFKKLDFSRVELLDPGKTNLKYHTSIDYFERDNESLYFEFVKYILSFRIILLKVNLLSFYLEKFFHPKSYLVLLVLLLIL